MALIVEDGTGKSDAESLASVADADTRLAGIGDTVWAALTTTVKEQNLRKATNFMLQRYRAQWQGVRMLSTQALDFPRAYVVVDGFDIASDAVPTDVANACIDLALIANDEELNPDKGQAVIRKKLGPLETQYDPASPQGTRYTAVDDILSPYLTGRGANTMATVRV